MDFLLAFTKGKKDDVKGKNPNPGKISKGIPTLKSNKQISDKQSSISKNSLVKEAKKPKVVDEIEKLQKKLQQTDQHIKQTEKKLDVDLFLKQQKDKRHQYAKDLNSQFQIQKKKRQQKLYKKYRDKEENEEGQIGQTKNVKTAFPLQLLKILENEKKSISKSQTIIKNHNVTLQSLENDSKLMDFEEMKKQENELLFELVYEGKNPEKQNSSKSSMSLKKIAQNMLNVNFFPIKFQGPLLQPALQYENIMNALTIMPQHLSNKYYSSKIHAGNQYFMSKMFLNGQRKSIITSDLIETRQFAHCHINLHSKMSDNRNFGPTIVQKCFRKVSSNLEFLDLSSSLYTLYGTDVQVIPISNRNYIKQNFQTILKFLLETGQLLAFMNDEGYNGKIYENRLYRLKEITQVVQLSEQQLQSKKKSKKKDKNKKNEEQQKDKQNFQRQHKVTYFLDNPYKGLVLDSKGLNKFQLLQVFQKFNKLILIRDYPKGWACKRINLELFSLGPVSITNKEWTKNNQYNFTVSSPVNMRVVMRKQQFSSAESIVKIQTNKDQDLQTNTLYGFLIFQCKEGEQKITCMKTDCLIARPKSTDSLEPASFCNKFQKGSYIIIPYSNKVSKTHYQFFNMDFFVEKAQSIQFGKAIINEWKWTKQNKSANQNQKVIQSLQNKQYIQRTKTEQIQMNRIAPAAVFSEKVLLGLEQKNLILSKDVKLNDLLIPGKLTKFLINPEIDVTKRTAEKQGNKKSKETKTDKGNKILISKNQEIECLQKQQALQILLGYDILQGEDIDRGLMMEQMDNNQEHLDFQHYGLGYDGLVAIMQSLMSYPTIRKLNLAHNDLDDTSIIFLCHYLDKGNRVELQELNVRGNSFGKSGIKAITGLMNRYQNLNVMLDQIMQ